MEYRISPYLTMKRYNANNWWISSDIVPIFCTSANNLNTALEKFVEHCRAHGVQISKNAMRTKRRMYFDNECTGYVLTGRTWFEDRSSNMQGYQYIDIWCDISIVGRPAELQKYDLA